MKTNIMKDKSFIIFTFLVLGLFCLLSLLFIHSISVSKNNTVNINDILMSSEKNWNSSFETLLEKADKYNLKICIIDNEQKVLAKSQDMDSLDINDCIKNNDILLDIIVDNDAKGHLIVKNSISESINSAKNNLYLITISSYLLLFIFIILYKLYLNKKILNPFKKLEGFAERIARGNLDIPLDMDKDNIFGAFTESFDIMRDELKIAKENEWNANQSKKELVASLSHDIKTPTATIKAISELLQAKLSDSFTINKLKIIEEKTDTISLLINNLFHATLEELQELKVEPKDMTSDIIKDLIISSDYNKKIHSISIPECIIKCDKLRLSQVIDNIISNSYKYALTDITVNSYIKNKYLYITFIDYGNTLSQDELPLLCQKFYRGSNSQNISGSGIGLYISKYFMNEMDGNLTIDKVPSGFSVTISIFIY